MRWDDSFDFPLGGTKYTVIVTVEATEHIKYILTSVQIVKDCISDVKTWMKSNKLKLIDDKTGSIRLCLWHQTRLFLFQTLIQHSPK